MFFPAEAGRNQDYYSFLLPPPPFVSPVPFFFPTSQRARLGSARPARERPDTPSGSSFFPPLPGREVLTALFLSKLTGLGF